MMENEAIELLSSFYEMDEMYAAAQVAIQALEEIQQYRAIGTVDEVAEMENSYINYFHKVRKYEAIGTIEEFKALKENQRKCEECAGCTEWLCDCANVRAKAIDDFLEKICEKYTEEERKGNYKQYCASIKQDIADIATEMRGAE